MTTKTKPVEGSTLEQRARVLYAEWLTKDVVEFTRSELRAMVAELRKEADSWERAAFGLLPAPRSRQMSKADALRELADKLESDPRWGLGKEKS